MATKRLLAPPGQRPTLVHRAEPEFESVSKRVPMIEKEEGKMVETMLVLDDQTRAKNREFQRNVDVLKDRIQQLRVKVEQTAEKRDHDDVILRERVERMVEDVDVTIEARLAMEMETLERDLMDPLRLRLKELREEMKEFLHNTIPQLEEEQSGQVVRKMLNSRETFDIDNTKILIREKKIVERFDTHCAETETRFQYEETDRINTFQYMEESIDERIRVEDRFVERFHGATVHSIKQLHERLAEECVSRGEQDKIILDMMANMMKTLQSDVLANFGAGKELDALMEQEEAKSRGEGEEVEEEEEEREEDNVAAEEEEEEEGGKEVAEEEEGEKK